MSIKDSFNSALIKNRPYTLDFGFMTDALNFLIYKKMKPFGFILQYLFLLHFDLHHHLCLDYQQLHHQ